MRGDLSRMQRCVAAGVVAVCGSVAAAQEADFRVLPYLQNPTSEGMSFTWFTEQNVAADLRITGGDLSSDLLFTGLTGQQMDNLTYTDLEIADAADVGYDIFSNNNYKYATSVSGLSPDTEYTYEVSLGGGESFSRTFRTAPTRDDWSHVRFVAYADSETEPRGNTTRRGWSGGVQAPGSVGRPAGAGDYPLTETEGYRRNLEIIDQRDPDFVVQAGDLIQGAGYQPGWDEYWRHNAGEYDDVLTKRPLLPAMGNWIWSNRLDPGIESVVDGRNKFKDYFDNPANNNPRFQDQYYRTDYGPVTVLTLDSTNGFPDDTPENYDQPVDDPYQIGTDTMPLIAESFYPGDDLADFNPGSDQYQWVQEQLQDARDSGQIVFVQFHHAPYSSGVHGFPMAHPDTTGQGGNPLRVYHEMFEEMGVAAVLSGHSEMFERSFVDEDGNGIGVHYYDVGVAGDGMRGRSFDSIAGELGGQNPFSQWTADGDSKELWLENEDGTFTLLDGGKHYGHLEVNIEKLLDPEGDAYARAILTPVYSFPLFNVLEDGTIEVLGHERRVYGDEITLLLDAQGNVIPEPTAAVAFLLAGTPLLLRRRRR